MEKNYILIYKEYITKDLGRYNIAQNLCRKLQQMIVEGKLPAGYMMPNENIVSSILCVGRSTLREAYIALEVLGLLQRSKAGTFISSTEDIQKVSPYLFPVNTIEEFVDVMEFRYMLEGEIVSYAAKRATVEDMDKLIEIHNKMVVSKRDIKEFVEYDRIFHRTLGMVCHNKMLNSTMTASKDIVVDEIFNGLDEHLTENPQAVQNIIDLHKKILDCIVVRDYKGATNAMHEHITQTNFLIKFTPKVEEEPIEIPEDPEFVSAKDSIRYNAKLTRRLANRVSADGGAKSKQRVDLEVKTILETGGLPKNKKSKPKITKAKVVKKSVELPQEIAEKTEIIPTSEPQLAVETNSMPAIQTQPLNKAVQPDIPNRPLTAKDLAERINFNIDSKK